MHETDENQPLRHRQSLKFFLMGLFLWVTFVFVALLYDRQPHAVKNISTSISAAVGNLYFTDKSFKLSLIGGGGKEYQLKLEPTDWKGHQYLRFDRESSLLDPQISLLIKKKSTESKEETVRVSVSAGWVTLPKALQEQAGDDWTFFLEFRMRPDLGFVSEPEEFEFRAIELLSDSPMNRLGKMWDSWWQFVPLSISSLNYWQHDYLQSQIAWSVLVLLTGWLLFAWLIKVPRSTVLISVGFIWLFFSFPALKNGWLVNQFVSESFQPNQGLHVINHQDAEMKEVSTKLSQVLVTEQLQHLPLIIIDNDVFEKSRLAYHLPHLNVIRFLNWSHLPLIQKNKKSDHLLFFVSESLMEDCQPDQSEQKALRVSELIWASRNHCLVQL